METNSATLELLRLDIGQAIKLDKLYRLSDLLVKHHRAIEDALSARQRKLFGTGGAVIFYDLTNTHMTGRPASELVKFGRSKQKRNDCPLVTLVLATDEGGFPRRSSVLPGIVSEPGTLLMDDVPWRKSSEVFPLSKPWREAFRNCRDASEALLANTHLAHRLQSNPFHFRRHSVKDKVEP